MANSKLVQLRAKREAMELILVSVSRYLSEISYELAGSPTLQHILAWQADINASIAQLQAIIREEATKEEILYLVDELRASAELASKEIAFDMSVVSGITVSWSDHLGSWRGKVVSVHDNLVKKMVTNFKAPKGTNREFELTRVGTSRNPMLYIDIESVDSSSEIAGTALRALSSVTLVSE